MLGNLFIISAPSGAGKTTILKQVLADLPGTVFSVSHTTRIPRPGEADGTDYHFVSRQEFISIRKRNAFLEWAEVHGNLYGTSIEAVKSQLESGLDVILDIDVQGAKQIRKQKTVPATSIFIAPPSADELRRRLSGRGTDSVETVELRLENAKKEMAEADLYEHQVINDDLHTAIEQVKSIILSKRDSP